MAAAPIEFGIVEDAGASIRKFAVESERNILLPAALVTRASGGTVKTVEIVLHPKGKSVAAEEVGTIAGRRDTALLFADLRGIGETFYDSRAGRSNLP